MKKYIYLILFLNVVFYTRCAMPAEFRHKVPIPDSLCEFKNNNAKLDLIKMSYGGIIDSLYATNKEYEMYIEPINVFITFTYTGTKKEIIEQKEILKREAKLIISAADTTYKILDKQESIYKNCNNDTLKIINMYSNYMKPLLLLDIGSQYNEKKYNLYDPTTITKLPKDYMIYVEKYGYTNVIPGYYKEFSFLPDRIKHGYASGTAFNGTDPYIIYWVTAW